VAGIPGAQVSADAAGRLNALCEQWLNPADPVIRESAVVSGYRDRVVAKDGIAAKQLKGDQYLQQPPAMAGEGRCGTRRCGCCRLIPHEICFRLAEISKQDAPARLYALNQDRQRLGVERRRRKAGALRRARSRCRRMLSFSPQLRVTPETRKRGKLLPDMLQSCMEPALALTQVRWACRIGWGFGGA